MTGKQSRLFLLIMMATFLGCLNALAQQAATEQFGQNRVQLRTFEWQYYDTTHFRILYYDYGKYNAQFLMQQAELDLPQIIFLMGAKLTSKIDVVLYNSFSDYKQTNIGRYNDEQTESQNGIVDVNRNTIVVYFDGTHDGMRKQIRKGIAKIIRDNLLFGYSLKDIVKNSVKMNLPTWYTNGYVEYISEDWDATRNAKLKSMLSKKQKLSFQDLAVQNNSLVGHSFFNFINKKYTQNAINNLLFQTRSRVAMSKAIQSVFEKKDKELYAEWKEFYQTPNDTLLYDSTGARKYLTVIKPRKGAVLKQFAVSPDGTVIAYSEFLDGQYQIKLFTVSNGKSKVIIEGGIRNSLEINDPNYPIICWNTDGKKLAVMYEKDYYQRLKIYDAKNGRVSDRIITSNKFDRINGMAFMEDDDKMVMSCIKKGQSDLFQFTIKNARLYQMTKDVWDDVAPNFVRLNGKTGIVFLSNRPIAYLQAPIKNDQLPNLPFHLYYYDDTDNRSSNILKLTDSVSAKISQPIQYGSENLAFMADVDGKQQRYIIHQHKISKEKDSIYYNINNAIDYSLLQHSYLQSKKSIIDIIDKKGKYYIYNSPISYLDTFDEFMQSANVLQINSSTITNQLDNKKTESYFLSEFENDVDSIDISKPKKEQYVETKTADIKPKRFRAKEYLATFSTDYLQTSADNSLLFNKYQKLDAGNSQFKYPELGALLRLSLMDVMEDYKITGGVRIPFDFSWNVAYMLKFANYRKRLDWEVAYHHNSDTLIKNNTMLPITNPFYSPVREFAKQNQNYLQARFIYPFNITTSIKWETGLRMDQLRYKASSEYSLRFATQTEYWWFNRVEYVVDNTVQPIQNIRKGTRLKVFGDAFLQLSGGKGTMVAFGFDARNYLGIYKNIILASRASSASSGGNRRMLYRVGGIDNELIPNANTNIPIMDTNITYGYQTTVTNMRGYKQNSRNGSSYIIVNEELRIPVVNTFTDRILKNKFLRNLQLVGFVDVGSAFTNLIDGAEDYTYPVVTTSNNVRVTSLQTAGATMFGYGGGFRTTIFGYYIHTDIGYNIDSRVPRFSVGLDMDF
jgi:hypothetical protein